MKYRYNAFTVAGDRRQGTLTAADPADATQRLKDMGLTPFQVTRQQDLDLPFFKDRGPSLKDRALFTQQFAQLLGSGTLSQAEALDVAARSTQNAHLRSSVDQIRQSITLGERLEDVFGRKEYARCFDPVFVAFIRMGVTQGNIVKPLRELAEMYKWNLKINGMVKKALTLPAVITLACVVVTYFIMARVVPTFMKILTDLNAELPPLTRAVKTVSGVLGNPLFFGGLLLSLIACSYLFRRYRQTREGHLIIDRLMLRLPIAGPLLKTFILARVSRGLSVMLRNDIGILEALDITSQVAANDVYKQHLQEMRSLVQLGRPMHPVLFQYPKEFSEQFALQFKSAEEQATVKDMLQYLSEIYNEEVTSAVESLTTAIEPLMIVFLGTLVALIVASVFLPMTTMMNKIGN